MLCCSSQILENGEDLHAYILMYAIMITANRRRAQVEVITMTFAKKTKQKKGKINKHDRNYI